MTRIKKGEDDLFFNNEEQDRLLTYWRGKAFKEDGKVGTSRNVQKWFMFNFIIGTGLRSSEFCNFRIGDLVIDSKLPRVRVRDGKGHKAREVFIGDKLVKDIRWFLNYKLKTLRQPMDSDDYLFPSEQKNKMSQVGLYYVWSKACEKALGKKYGVHAGRHTYGYNYYSKEKDIVATKEQLGHSNIATTNRYTRSTPEDKIRQANK